MRKKACCKKCSKKRSHKGCKAKGGKFWKDVKHTLFNKKRLLSAAFPVPAQLYNNIRMVAGK